MGNKFLVGVAVAAAVTLVPLASTAAPERGDRGPAGHQADSVRFELGTHVVYCGVDRGAEPYRLDVTLVNDPRDDDAGPMTAWVGVGFQSPSFNSFPEFGVDRLEVRVPYNESLSFGHTLGGNPGVDQIVQLASPPLGDEFGGGRLVYGIASVLAGDRATDPFDGDGRSDNYCVSIGGEGAEFPSGAISTRLPVPDWWVGDGDGSDGGILASPAD